MSTSQPNEPGAFEGRLRAAFARRGSSTGPEPAADWEDLAGRISRDGRRRQRMLGGLAGVTLLAGAAAGYFGAASTGTPSRTAAISSIGTSRAAAATNGASGASNLRRGALAQTPGAGGPALSTPATAAPCGSTGVGSGPSSSTAACRTHLFTRTTADGITLRAYGGNLCAPRPGVGGVPTSGTTTTVAPGPGSTTTSPTTTTTAPGTSTTLPVFSPPTGANAPTGAAAPAPSGAGAAVPAPCAFYTVEMSDAAAVATVATAATSGSLGMVRCPTSTPDAHGTLLADSSSPFGVAEGDPAWSVVAVVSSSVSSVSVVFADGSTDTMAPVAGVVALAHLVDPAKVPNVGEPTGTLSMLDASGKVLGTALLTPGGFLPGGAAPVSGPCAVPGSKGGPTTTVAPTPTPTVTAVPETLPAGCCGGTVQAAMACPVQLPGACCSAEAGTVCPA